MNDINAVVGKIMLVLLLPILFSFPIMWLWNGCLVPAVHGIEQIGVFQALGLSVLCSLLFKSTITTATKV